MNNPYLLTITLLLLTSLTTGCASLSKTPVPESITTAPEPDHQYSEVLAEHYQGEKVRWGGDIIDIDRLDPSKARITVIEQPILENGTPDYLDNTQQRRRGRFIAVLDPTQLNRALRRNRFIIIYGEISGFEERFIKDTKELIPVIETSDSYVWSTTRRHHIAPYSRYRYGHIHNSFCPIDHFYYSDHYYRFGHPLYW